MADVRLRLVIESLDQSGAVLQQVGGKLQSLADLASQLSGKGLSGLGPSLSKIGEATGKFSAGSSAALDKASTAIQRLSGLDAGNLNALAPGMKTLAGAADGIAKASDQLSGAAGSLSSIAGSAGVIKQVAEAIKPLEGVSGAGAANIKAGLEGIATASAGLTGVAEKIAPLTTVLTPLGPAIAQIGGNASAAAAGLQLLFTAVQQVAAEEQAFAKFALNVQQLSTAGPGIQAMAGTFRDFALAAENLSPGIVALDALVQAGGKLQSSAKGIERAITALGNLSKATEDLEPVADAANKVDESLRKTIEASAGLVAGLEKLKTPVTEVKDALISLDQELAAKIKAFQDVGQAAADVATQLEKAETGFVTLATAVFNFRQPTEILGQFVSQAQALAASAEQIKTIGNAFKGIGAVSGLGTLASDLAILTKTKFDPEKMAGIGPALRSLAAGANALGKAANIRTPAKAISDTLPALSKAVRSLEGLDLKNISAGLRSLSGAIKGLEKAVPQLQGLAASLEPLQRLSNTLVDLGVAAELAGSGAGGVGRLATALGRLGPAIDKVNLDRLAQLELLGTTLQTLAAPATQAATAMHQLADAVQRLQSLGVPLGQAARAAGQFTVAQQQATQAAQAGGQAAQQAGQQTQQMGQQAQQAGQQAQQAGQATQQMGQQAQLAAQQATQAMEEFERAINDVRTGIDQVIQAATTLGFVGAAITAAAVFPIHQAAQFERALSRVEAFVEENTRAMGLLKNKAIELSKSQIAAGRSAKEMADGMAALAKAGFDAAQILDLIQPTLILATAGEIDMGQAGEFLANAMRAMGAKASEAGHFVDLLAKGAAISTADVRDLAKSFSFAAPAAALVGQDVEELTAMLAVLANQAVRATRGGTAVRGLMVGILSDTSRAKKVFDELGDSLVLTAEGGVDVQASLNKMLAQGASVNDFVRVFTRHWGALAANLARVDPEFQRVLKQLQDVGGEGLRIAGIMERNVIGATYRLIAALNALTITAADPLLGPLFKAINALAAIARAGEGAAKEFQGTTAFVLATVASFGLFLVGATALGVALGWLFRIVVGGIGGWTRLGRALLRARTWWAASGRAVVILRSSLLLLGTTLLWLSRIALAIEIGRIIKLTYDWIKANRFLKRTQEELAETQKDLKDRFKEFADFKPPTDITGKTKEELAELDRQLGGSIELMKILRDEKKKIAESEEGLFGKGIFSEEARKSFQEAREELKLVESALKDMRRDKKLAVEEAGEIELVTPEAIKRAAELRDWIKKLEISEAQLVTRAQELQKIMNAPRSKVVLEAERDVEDLNQKLKEQLDLRKKIRLELSRLAPLPLRKTREDLAKDQEILQKIIAKTADIAADAVANTRERIRRETEADVQIFIASEEGKFLKGKVTEEQLAAIKDKAFKDSQIRVGKELKTFIDAQEGKELSEEALAAKREELEKKEEIRTEKIIEAQVKAEEARGISDEERAVREEAFQKRKAAILDAGNRKLEEAERDHQLKLKQIDEIGISVLENNIERLKAKHAIELESFELTKRREQLSAGEAEVARNNILLRQAKELRDAENERLDILLKTEALRVSLFADARERIEAETKLEIDAFMRSDEARQLSAEQIQQRIFLIWVKGHQAILEEDVRFKEEEREELRARDEALLRLEQTRTDTMLAELERRYDMGLVDLTTFMEQRRALILSNLDAEIAEIEKKLKEEEAIFPMGEKARILRIELDIKKAEKETTEKTVLPGMDQAAMDKATQDAVEFEIERSKILAEGIEDRFDREQAAFEAEILAERLQNGLRLEEWKRANISKAQRDELAAAQEMAIKTKIKEHERATLQLRLDTLLSFAEQANSIFSDLYEASGQKIKAFFYLQKAVSVAEAIISTMKAANDAMADTPGPIWVKQAAAALAVAAGMARVATILNTTIQGPGARKGGLIEIARVMKATQQKASTFAKGGAVVAGRVNLAGSQVKARIPAWLTNKEYVMGARAVQRYGLGVMEAINQKRAVLQQFVPKPGFSSSPEGGLVRGPEGQDVIPAWLSNLQYVVRPEAVSHYGVSFLEAMNRGLLSFDGAVRSQSHVTHPPIITGEAPEGKRRGGGFAGGGVVAGSPGSPGHTFNTPVTLDVADILLAARLQDGIKKVVEKEVIRVLKEQI